MGQPSRNSLWRNRRHLSINLITRQGASVLPRLHRGDVNNNKSGVALEALACARLVHDHGQTRQNGAASEAIVCRCTRGSRVQGQHPAAVATLGPQQLPGPKLG